tara:strand:- start:465 stop:1352 length:888 start_codon:yes stop_codon:yes gene_type:complete
MVLLNFTIYATPKSFFDDFSQGIDTTRWTLVNKQWGGDNGGVSSKNVYVISKPYPTLILQAHGDKYDGEIIGINGKRTRIGAAIATKNYYASGTFSVCAKLPKVFGAASAFWLFHYKELTNADADYNSSEDPIRNSEIDWEMPSDDGSNKKISYQFAKINAWGGQKPGVEDYFAHIIDIQTVNNNKNPADDEKFHKYEIIWQPRKILSNGQTQSGFIDWRFASKCDQPAKSVYLLKGSISGKDDIPQVPMQFWLGIWFPVRQQAYLGQYTGWAGTPNFSQTQLEIKWVSIKTVPE